MPDLTHAVVYALFLLIFLTGRHYFNKAGI